METIKNILIKGIAKKGNSFKITFTDLLKESNTNETDLCIALNSITQFNAWDLVIN
jgi:hypothetical protein